MGSMSYNSYEDLLGNKPIDEPRRMRVICIGAGVSGILTAIRFPREIPNLDLVVYEKNSDVGGTWLENCYPGVRCDIPSAGYQFTFEDNPAWTEFYASGEEIQAYWTRTARKYGVYKYCQFNHRFEGARWNEMQGQWEVTLHNNVTGQPVIDTADFVISATGLLNRREYPKIPGLETFTGPKMHTARWDSNIELENKRIALIGAGSTGIQILPSIQPIVQRVDHYVRGQNWISPLGIGGEELIRRKNQTGNFKHSPEELWEFRHTPGTYHAFRHRIEGDINQAPYAVFTDHPAQEALHALTLQSMKAKLESKPRVAEALTPQWPVGCKRLTPGPGYLEACCKSNVDYINTPIKSIGPDSIETADGTIRETDVIICATGFNVTRTGGPQWIGRGGATLDTVWNPDPVAYISLFPPEMPNMFIYFGPNGGPLTGSTMHMLEWSCEYMIKTIQKCQREYIRSISASKRAITGFQDHCEKFFDRTVFMKECPSWFKRGQAKGRQVTSWPGSGVHARQALLNPRWEDFDYEYLDSVADIPLGWMGNGMTVAQVQGTKTTDYLDPPIVPQYAAVEQDSSSNGNGIC
ncbi:hypothetical protein FE257_010709 [Aspergillus nanangensis]|uniref:Flavin-binding monooxygenase n=1 Tax=Aspergillus nanangensis TaxID=2582783 RepID=A0AAD4CJK5_ASPNN|nr:hypothetical protein FE257_010709 [Aspergillus nanangensis]